MKKTLITLLIILAVVLLAGWLLYPVISDQVSQGRNAALMQTYDKNVREMTPEQITASFAQAEAYNAELEGNGLPDVFTQEQRTVSRQYQNALDIHNGIIGELTIDRIGVSLPVYHAGADTSRHRRAHPRSDAHADAGAHALPASALGKRRLRGLRHSL